MVLTEVLNSFSDGGPLRHAVGGMVQKLRSNRDVIIVPQTSEQFENALRRYKQAADKSWSLTDCASFEVMAGEQIQAALTHDQHFAQAGFEALLRPKNGGGLVISATIATVWDRIEKNAESEFHLIKGAKFR